MNLRRMLPIGVIAALAAIVIGVALTPRTAENRPLGMDSVTFTTDAAGVPISPVWDAF